MHTRKIQCNLGVNASQKTVRDCATINDCVELAFAIDIGDKGAATTQKSKILDSFNGLANQGVSAFHPTGHEASALSGFAYAARASNTASTMGT